MPQLWIVAGPNGVGKSTLTSRYLEGRLQIVDPDVIARELAPTEPPRIRARMQAGREAIRRQEGLLTQGADFAVETTLSGNRELSLLRRARAAGYKVTLVYIGVNSPAPGEQPTAAVELHDNILLRFNLTEKRAVGLTLMDFSVLVQMTQLGPRSFPLSGLKDLEPEWQETVIETITKPPVNQILRVSSYMPSIPCRVRFPEACFVTVQGPFLSDTP